jgi:hypothetical protein
MVTSTSALADIKIELRQGDISLIIFNIAFKLDSKLNGEHPRWMQK